MRKTFYISEYGTIRSKQDFGNLQSNLTELYLNQEIFSDVYQSIIELQESNIEVERPFVLFTKKGKHQIRVKNFVGILESRKGFQIEILPKIFSNSPNFGVDEVRSVFLNMLKRLKNSPFVNLNEANLKSQSNYPILEVFIKSFIDEGMKIFKEGLKSDYLDYQENTTFLKGKLMISDHIKQNMFNKTRFNCKFNIYSEDIPVNRIVKTTLLKLKKISRSHKNLSLINSLLVYFDQVESSVNIQKELNLITNNNRLLSNYNRILSWSKVFLTDSSFTNFSGDNRNLAILFPMEKVFEDYIGYLFKKYSNGIQIKLQDQSYFLVESHKGNGKFRLKPDIVTSSSVNSKIIIDTKWKLINQYAERSNYYIKQPDMYQLYAYGKKYTVKTSPLLILLYPKNENFTHMIKPFNYEGNLKLLVVPFDLSGDEIYHASQIKNLLSHVYKTNMTSY